jgi:hypothetical protein
LYIGQHPAKPIEPTAQRLFVVARPAQCMIACEVMSHVWHQYLQHLVVVVILDIGEALAHEFLDEVAVNHCFAPHEHRGCVFLSKFNNPLSCQIYCSVLPREFTAMDVWLMTDPIFWVTLGAWSGFCIGVCTGALMMWWHRRPKPSAVSPE